MFQKTPFNTLEQATTAPPLPAPFAPGKDLPAKCLACGGLISQSRHMGEGRSVVEWKCVNCGRTIGNVHHREEPSQDPPIEHYRNNLKKINGESWRSMPAPLSARKKKSGRGKDNSGPSTSAAETDPETAILSITAIAAEREERVKDSDETGPETDFSVTDLPEEPPIGETVVIPPLSSSQKEPASAHPTPSLSIKATENPGHEIRRRRKALGLSLPAFGEMIGKNPSAISFLESRAENDTPAVLELKNLLSRIESGETINPALLQKRPRKTPVPATRKPSKELREVRRKRLEILCRHFECPSQLAKRLSIINSGTLWKILNDKLGMGDKLSRRIESLLSIPTGWMDEPGPVDLVPLLGEPINRERKSRQKPSEKGSERKIPTASTLPATDREGEKTVVHISGQMDAGQTMPADLKVLLGSLTADPRIRRIDIVSITLKDSPGPDVTASGLSP